MRKSTSLPVVYYSSVSQFTHKFVNTVLAVDPAITTFRIPMKGNPDFDMETVGPAVLMIPSYLGSQSAPELRHVPVHVMKWMKSIGREGRANIYGVVGIGNTNFGVDFCASAVEVSNKLGIPIIGRYELSGLPGDHEDFVNRLNVFSQAVADMA